MATQTDAAAPSDPTSAGSEASLDSGNYEVLKRRLEAEAKALRDKADALNVKRQEAFGGSELAIIASERVRTDNNCVPRDIVALGDHLLFGYNVQIQLREQTEVEEVLSFHRFLTTETGFDFPAAPAAEVNPGLFGSEAFQREFRELFAFYAKARLAHMRINDAGNQLLVVFKVGDNLGDIKVMRWRLDKQQQATYIDNRGERDYVFPPSHDFRWTATTRENQRTGRAPHLSVLDKVFVGAHGGALVLKVEDNTESGKAILTEGVEDDRQALDDLKVEYAEVGTLILLKILPFRETTWRYIVYNTRAKTAVRIDAIGQACVSLPEDHGVIFPGGYYLQTGEFKVFDVDTTDLAFKRAIRSPNGEDVLYVFYQRDKGHYTLLPYNLIRQAVQNPIHCDGYCLYEDGRMVVFSHVGETPTRVHPMQVWQTPFTSAEFAAASQGVGGFLGKVGNADLVRGISEAHTIVRRVQNQTPTRQRYEDLVAALTRTLDSYYWLGDPAVGDFKSTLEQLRVNAEQIIDEFEKVLAMRAQAEAAVSAASATQDDLLHGLDYARWTDVDPFMEALSKLRSQRGHLITLREMRYIDLARLDALEADVSEAFDRVSKGAVEFLLDDKALAPLIARSEALLGKVEATEKVAEMKPHAERLDALTTGLNVLSEVVSTLDIEDATARTRILEGISEAFSHLNRVRAIYQSRRKALLGKEGRDAFAAQFRLFGQAVGSAIAMAETPDACDTQLSRMMVQLEELESRFSEFDEFLETLAVKRDEVYEAFSTKKQTLLDAVQRRAQNMASAGARVLDGITRRARSFRAEDELNGYFASDQMVLKLRQLAEQLLELGDSVKADELLSKVKAAQQDALRGLRDKLELFDAGTDVIKFGKHRFNVNTQPLELTMVPRDETMALHLTGTDYYEAIDDPAFEATRRFWSRDVVSESPTVYRGEYLAASIFFAAEAGADGLTMHALHEAALDAGDGLLKLVRGFAGERYAEGYERGIHDSDAAAILGALLTLSQTAGLLRFSANARALACLFWAFQDEGPAAQRWKARAVSLGQLQTVAETTALTALGAELSAEMTAFFADATIPAPPTEVAEAGRYLARELTAEIPQFVTSGAAEALRDQVVSLHPGSLEDDLRQVGGDHDAQLLLAQAWVDAAVTRASSGQAQNLAPYALEAAVLCLTDRRIKRTVSQAMMHTTIDGLLGQHAVVKDRQLVVRLDELLPRLRRFLDEEVPAYLAYRELMATLVQRRRAALRIDEFKPRVLTSFVRNKLINDVYLPLLGDNLAKQMGAVGAGKRTDLMGLLLLISPPGYGKTTLMEYVASRLGLVFMKINGPSLGHAVHSLDPAEAPNATARQEVDKINLALEMGNNVMLYLDDIQHTHPELLQKFISLCDAQRRIEGVWNGETRTYDLRGKKFCVVMAGNPYTESGESFQIPDMLANRADIYNLGDILAGQSETFALSYLENSLTSNPTLAPIATRGQADFYKLVRMAQGEDVPTSDLGYSYSAAELAEIMRVLKHLFRAQDVLLKVNQQYIASASMDDKYRTEPPFKLQGSYRNMNKLSEKIVAALNDVELEAILDDHYVGEAQTLTTGAEANLLKLREMRAVLTDEQAKRWADIKQEFVRQRSLGGDEDDPVTRVTGQLSLMVRELDAIRGAVGDAAAQATQARATDQSAERDGPGSGSSLLAPLLLKLHEALDKLRRPQLAVHVEQAPQPEFGRFFDEQNQLVQQTLLPVAQAAAKNLEEGSQLTRELIALIERLEAAGVRPTPR